MFQDLQTSLSSVAYGDITVFYRPELDGGGRTFGQDYIDYVSNHIDEVDRVFEWCCGPAFIGFALLAQGLCKSLCLADVNPAVLQLVRKTVEFNGLDDVVSVYESDNLDGIPASEKWDLVVGNPPHFVSERAIRRSRLQIPFVHSPRYLIRKCMERMLGARNQTGHVTRSPFLSRLLQVDNNWNLHRRFFANVKPHLNAGAPIVIQENRLGSRATTFQGMLDKSGLHLIRARTCRGNPTYYFLHVAFGAMNPN